MIIRVHEKRLEIASTGTMSAAIARNQKLKMMWDIFYFEFILKKTKKQHILAKNICKLWKLFRVEKVG